MQSFKLSLVLFATLMFVHGVPELSENFKLFEECAEANNFKFDREKLKQLFEGVKYDDKELKNLEIPQEFLCTERCFHEKKGLIEEGKFNLEKVKAEKFMMRDIPADKIETYLNCLKEIEVTECEDLKKSFECRDV